MRVCFYHLEPAWSARARIFADAAGALKSRGFEVTMVCARDSEVARRFGASGHETIVLRTNGGWLRAGWRLRAVLKRHFVEVVFVHSEFEQLAASAAVRLADRGAVVRRIPALGRLTLGGDGRMAMRLAATGFLFAFPDDARGAPAPTRALEPVIAPPGVVTAALRVPRETGVRTIACIFDAAQRERVAIALRTIAMLAERHPELRCSLIGPAGDDDSLRIQAAALGIGEIIRWTGNPSDRDDVLASADLAWLIAESDDLACGLLDCFACGVGIIAERTPLSTRFVTDGIEGVLTAGLDASGYAALIASLLADNARRGAFAAAAREAAARWPIGAMGDGFERSTTSARDRTRWRV